MTHVPFSFLQVLPIFLYAETHYRFRYFFSYLRKREPEIIADAPYRIDPHLPLPVLILIKDAHLFPIQLTTISITIRSKSGIVRTIHLLKSPIEINARIWHRILQVSLDDLTGWIECDVEMTINVYNQKRIYYNDNYRTSSHHPLKIFVSKDPLPKFKQLHFGECHSHSSFTDDQVEFGAPLEASSLLCRPLGLSFQCVTDHSYDLDDSTDNYLLNDPKLPKWHLLQQLANKLNRKCKDFIVVRGEEVSSHNSANQNIHLLLLGNRKYFSGSGDGAERWFKTHSEHTIPDVLENRDSSSIAFAAHPRENVSILQRLLLHRGKWNEQDFTHKKLSGIQFINGKYTDGFQEGYGLWIKALLEGKHLFALAGNDAHGNFNRFRQIGIPFFKIREMNDQLFGKMRTGVFLQSLSEKKILRAIDNGFSILSDGPIANICVNPNRATVSSIGRSYKGKKHTLVLEVNSSNEFGSFDSIQIFQGYFGGKSETVIYSEKHTQSYRKCLRIKLEIQKSCYVRAEVWTSSDNSCDKKAHFCITNPVWFSPS